MQQPKWRTGESHAESHLRAVEEERSTVSVADGLKFLAEINAVCERHGLVLDEDRESQVVRKLRRHEKLVLLTQPWQRSEVLTVAIAITEDQGGA